VAFLLIAVATAGKTSSYVTSLPIVGGIVASGVFLLFIAIIGLVGAVKHNQILLFFYMVVLFANVLIQFSVACACLAVDTQEELDLASKVHVNFTLETLRFKFLLFLNFLAILICSVLKFLQFLQLSINYNYKLFWLN
jgi:hypothetical protein